MSNTMKIKASEAEIGRFYEVGSRRRLYVGRIGAECRLVDQYGGLFSVSPGREITPLNITNWTDEPTPTTPDPGEGWRIAEGDNWKDERCEVWNSGRWEPRGNPGDRFVVGWHYRVPIDPAPKHPPVPEGWRLVDPKKDLPKRGSDRYWSDCMGKWHEVHHKRDKTFNDGFCDGIIYIRRIEPACRPFASAEEFDPYAHRIVVNIGTGTRRRIDHWSDTHVNGMTWDVASRKYRFLVDGKQTFFGAEVKP